MAVARSLARTARLTSSRPALRLLAGPVRTHATALDPPLSSTRSSDRAFESSYDPVDVGPVSVQATDTAQPGFGGRLDTLAVGNGAERRVWSREEVQELYDTPLMELVFRAVGLRSLQMCCQDSWLTASVPTRRPFTGLITIPARSSSALFSTSSELSLRPLPHNGTHSLSLQRGWLHGRLLVLCSIVSTLYRPESVEARRH